MTTILTLESSVAQLVFLGIVFLLVIFLLLFLLYRERRLPSSPEQRPNYTLNFTPTWNQQVLDHRLKKSGSEVDGGEKGKERQRTEKAIKIEEPGNFVDSDARVRHRKVQGRLGEEAECISQYFPGPGNDEVEEDGRVFNPPQVTGPSGLESQQSLMKAFFDTAPGSQCRDSKKSSKKLDKLEMGKVTSVEGKGKKPNCQVPTIESGSSTESFEFAVDKKGCQVVTKYCKVFIPPNSVQQPETIVMTPDYNMRAHSPCKVIITPYVSFKSRNGKEIKFQRDVTVSLRSGYSATGDKKNIPVQVLWRPDSKTPLKCIHQTTLGHGKFIPFICRHFCGYCIAAEQENFHSMKRHYYYAAYVRKSPSPTRVLHWMLFEDCPALYDRKVSYMKNDPEKELAMDPESFEVDYGYSLQMVVRKHQICPGEDGYRDINLTEVWGTRVDTTHQVEMKNICGQLNTNLKVKYAMFALHGSGAMRTIKDQHFFYSWNDPPLETPMPSTIYVRDNAIGVQVNMPNAGAAVQSQESVESNTSVQSSGYGSPPVSSRTFSLSEGNVTSLQASSHNSGFNDNEESVMTTPKRLKDIGNPVYCSTPNRAPVTPEDDSGMERSAEDSNLLPDIEATDEEQGSHSSQSMSLDSSVAAPHIEGMTNDDSVPDFSIGRDSGLDTFNASSANTDSLMELTPEDSSDPNVVDTQLPLPQHGIFSQASPHHHGTAGESEEDIPVFDHSPTSDSQNEFRNTTFVADVDTTDENGGTEKETLTMA